MSHEFRWAAEAVGCYITRLVVVEGHGELKAETLYAADFFCFYELCGRSIVHCWSSLHLGVDIWTLPTPASLNWKKHRLQHVSCALPISLQVLVLYKLRKKRLGVFSDMGLIQASYKLIHHHCFKVSNPERAMHNSGLHPCRPAGNGNKYSQGTSPEAVYSRC